MILAERFIANKALDFDFWLAARRSGVTATQVAKASTSKGFREAVEQWHSQEEIPDNPYMAFGRESEAWISLWVKDRFGIMPNEWLITHDDVRWHTATPDGLSLDHLVISEVKTTGQDWQDDKIPVQYRRQVQWQLHVTGAEYCVFAWIRRIEVGGVLVSADFEPHVIHIQRDEKMIEKLCRTAETLWAETGGKKVEDAGQVA